MGMHQGYRAVATVIAQGLRFTDGGSFHFVKVGISASGPFPFEATEVRGGGVWILGPTAPAKLSLFIAAKLWRAATPIIIEAPRRRTAFLEALSASSPMSRRTRQRKCRRADHLLQHRQRLRRRERRS